MPYRAPSRVGVTPQHRGRFPGFDVLDLVDTWDDVTAGVVLARLQPAADLSFFTAAENAVADPLCDLLLAQDGEPRIPVVALIDARLAADETDGWRYDDMADDAQAWRETLAALDADARDTNAEPFHAVHSDQQAALVQAVYACGQRGERWHGWAAEHVWSLWTRYACAAFYSHPWAWNEIGFGGPAYPRGYKNLGLDAPERWEKRDRDDADPVTFSRRIEAARQAHQSRTGAEAAGHGDTRGHQGDGPASGHR